MKLLSRKEWELQEWWIKNLNPGNADPGVTDGSALPFLSRGEWATSIPKSERKWDMKPRQALFRTSYSMDHQFFEYL